MSYLREDIERTNLDIPDGEIEIVSAADPVYANALEVHKKKKEETEKAMAKKEDEVKDGVLGTKGKTTTYPMTKDLKKMKLSEKLFEDYEDSDWKSIDKAVEKDLWTSIYNELNGDIKRLDAKTRRFVRKPSERYSEKDLSTSGDIITVYANDSERLDFAKEVAEEYGVKYNVTEHTSRYAPARFSMNIYTSEPVTNESLDNAKVFGRKAKELTEDVTITEESDLTDFEFWSGAKDTVAVMTSDDIRTISNYLGELYPEGMTPTQINDFFWFEDETIANWLGYDSFEDYENRDLEEDVNVSKYGFGSKLKSGIAKFFQGKEDFEKALDDGEGFKGAIDTAKKKSSDRDEEKRLEQQKLSHKRDNRLPAFILKQLISWRDDHGGHTREGSTRLTKYIEDIRKQGEKHPTIISAAKKMRVSPSEYYDMWDKAADTALKFKKTPTAKIKISYK